MLEAAEIKKGLGKAISESSGRKEGGCEERLDLLREYPCHPEQKYGRNTDRKGHSDEVSGE